MDRITPLALDNVAKSDLVGQLEEMSLAPNAEDGIDSDGFRSKSRRAQFVRFRVATDSVARGTALNRRENLAEGGAMMTTVGASSVYGQFSENRGIVPPKSAKEAETVDALRAEVKSAMPGMSFFLFLSSLIC